MSPVYETFVEQNNLQVDKISKHTVIPCEPDRRCHGQTKHSSCIACFRRTAG